MGSKKRKKKQSVRQGRFDYFEIFKCSGLVTKPLFYNGTKMIKAIVAGKLSVIVF